MEKKCPDCHRVFHERYYYCAYCGEKLLAPVSREKIYKKLEGIEKGTRFAGVIAISFAVMSVGIASMFAGISLKVWDFIYSGLFTYIVGIGIFIMGVITNLIKKK